MTNYIAHLVDENFDSVYQLADYLYLEMARSDNAIGTLVLRLPTRYEIFLDNIGLLESLQAAISLPRFFLHIYEEGRGTCCLWEESVWIIDKPARVREENGDFFIQLEAIDQMGILEYRSIFADEDNPITTKSLQADTFCHEVFTEHFGDVQALDARRDWITAGTVVDGADGACGYTPYEPRLEFKGTLLTIMQDASKASQANNLPFKFDLVPTIVTTPLGERAALPLIFNTYCGHRGADRSITNTDGNDPVLLSVAIGAISSYTLGPDFRDDFSVAMAVGAGSGATRPRQIRINNDRVNSSRWGWKESITIDREAEDQASADSAADEFLEEGNSRGQFVVKLTDAPAARYGMPGCGGSYHWGDCVTICDNNTAINVRVTAISITVDRGEIDKRIKLEITDDQP